MTIKITDEDYRVANLLICDDQCGRIGTGMVCSGEKNAAQINWGSRTTVTITTKGTNARRGHGTLCYPEFLMDTR